MDSNSSVVCSQQEKGCAAHADAKVLNALALETNEDSSVTTEHGDCPVGNSGSNIDGAVVNSTEATVQSGKPALVVPKKGDTLQGTLVVLCPNGTQVSISTLFDSGSGTDAISTKAATTLKQSGIAWGNAGGSLITTANRGEIIPVGALRLLLHADPKQVAVEGAIKVPRQLTFLVDAEIVENLTTDLVIGWQTLVSTGLLNIIFGLESHEPDGDDDTDDLGDLWPDDLDVQEYDMPTVLGDPDSEEVRRVKDLCVEFKHLFGKVPFGGSKLPPMDIELKKDSQGEIMRPNPQKCRPVTPHIAKIIEEDALM